MSTIRPPRKASPKDPALRRKAANFFRSARCSLGLSCDEIAALIGWSARSYGYWEKGEAAAPTDAYLAVRALLAERNLDSQGRIRVA